MPIHCYTANVFLTWKNLDPTVRAGGFEYNLEKLTLEIESLDDRVQDGLDGTIDTEAKTVVCERTLRLLASCRPSSENLQVESCASREKRTDSRFEPSQRLPDWSVGDPLSELLRMRVPGHVRIYGPTRSVPPFRHGTRYSPSLSTISATTRAFLRDPFGYSTSSTTPTVSAQSCHTCWLESVPPLQTSYRTSDTSGLYETSIPTPVWALGRAALDFGRTAPPPGTSCVTARRQITHPSSTR